MKPMERRLVPAGEIWASSDGGVRRLAGKAVPYNSFSVFMGFYDRVLPVCFDKTLREAENIYSLWNHESGKPLGRTGNGTLTLKDEPDGLYYDVVLPDTSWGEDAFKSVERKDVNHNSFGFRVIQDRWHYDKIDGVEVEVRDLVECELREISPCTFAAYQDTSLATRAVLVEMGVDPEDFAGTMARAIERRGREEVRAILADSVDRIRAACSCGCEGETPADGTKPDENGQKEETPDYSLLKKRLELEEMAV